MGAAALPPQVRGRKGELRVLILADVSLNHQRGHERGDPAEAWARRLVPSQHQGHGHAAEGGGNSSPTALDQTAGRQHLLIPGPLHLHSVLTTPEWESAISAFQWEDSLACLPENPQEELAAQPPSKSRRPADSVRLSTFIRCTPWDVIEIPSAASTMSYPMTA